MQRKPEKMAAPIHPLSDFIKILRAGKYRQGCLLGVRGGASVHSNAKGPTLADQMAVIALPTGHSTRWPRLGSDHGHYTLDRPCHPQDFHRFEVTGATWWNQRGLGGINAGLGGINARPGGINARPGGINGCPCGINARPGGINARPGGINARPGGINACPGGINGCPCGINARPGGINARPGGINARPGGINAHPGGINARPCGINERPGGINA
ncbi:hypothetical protein EGW08_012220 [Elysia chlorotica]|uniref:Uncharacterized protein n=1 Tax=Elysia chlorotica TaxID=188477 RepID=A0A3S0ZKR1_ELYCH|nr:hypothetical protein EGW08_012220 [Elysia chlorotica]